MIEEITMRIAPEIAADLQRLKREAARQLHIPERSINDLRIVRKSVDARKRPVMLNVKVMAAVGDSKEISPIANPIDYSPVAADAKRIVIVGAGPAGLFAALKAIELGLKPIVIERGRDVDSRRLDLAKISRSKQIDPDSNYCFGEGGAGAYSDGKLYTRSKKRGSVEEVLQIFVQHGAKEEILIDSHPHIGSDRLPHVIREIRETIIRNGGEVHFETKVTGLLRENQNIAGVVTEKGEIRGDSVILATGHSARDTFRAMRTEGVAMEAKGIAVGVRLEHPQHLIDQLQYHSAEGRGKWLPAAEYSYVAQADGRGVYSFCMCPGGVIVPAGSEHGELVVNGMSASARAGKFANSGMVVEIHPGDIEGFADEGEFEMLALQESLERKMYEAAGESIVAPAQRMTDFIGRRKSTTLPATSYAPGIQPGDFNELLPDFISRRLRKGFEEFGKRSRGFTCDAGIMIGLESRTSSPIRITRDAERLESVNTPGLYPVGEGAGYAGGIVSAAIDGQRAAIAAAAALANKK